MKALDLEEVASMLRIKARTLADKRYRTRLGLPAMKIGRWLVFDEADVLRVLEAGKEVLPEKKGERK